MAMVAMEGDDGDGSDDSDDSDDGDDSDESDDSDDRDGSDDSDEPLTARPKKSMQNKRIKQIEILRTDDNDDNNDVTMDNDDNNDEQEEQKIIDTVDLTMDNDDPNVATLRSMGIPYEWCISLLESNDNDIALAASTYFAYMNTDKSSPPPVGKENSDDDDQLHSMRSSIISGLDNDQQRAPSASPFRQLSVYNHKRIVIIHVNVYKDGTTGLHSPKSWAKKLIPPFLEDHDCSNIWAKNTDCQELYPQSCMKKNCSGKITPLQPGNSSLYICQFCDLIQCRFDPLGLPQSYGKAIENLRNLGRGYYKQIHEADAGLLYQRRCNELMKDYDNIHKKLHILQDTINQYRSKSKEALDEYYQSKHDNKNNDDEDDDDIKIENDDDMINDDEDDPNTTFKKRDASFLTFHQVEKLKEYIHEYCNVSIFTQLTYNNRINFEHKMRDLATKAENLMQLVIRIHN